jgi:hypothetical protein
VGVDGVGEGDIVAVGVSRVTVPVCGGRLVTVERKVLVGVGPTPGVGAIAKAMNPAQ